MESHLGVEQCSRDTKSAMNLRSKSVVTGAFNRLPDEIIYKILQLTTPNSFASLTILNTKWRKVSQQASFYADHLARCPSYAAANPGPPPADDEGSLPRLRRLFAKEVKRCLFEAYLRPQETVINLVSTSISSSSAPGGEAFHFSLSPRGHYVLAYSSSRIHVLDVTGSEIQVKRELKILRRPASTTITDDGFTLAVLSTDLQVDLYELRSSPPKHTRAVALDHTPRTIALSPTGSVLACAYDAGVEVSSLDTSSTNTDRRAVKCYAVDSLSFSQDGTQLLGSTIQDRNPSTVVLTAPYYDPGGNLPEDVTSALWTTSILFPNGSRDCSHAVLLPNPSDGDSSWTFTYDRVFETFRTVRIDDLRNGTTYFTGPVADSTPASKLLPSTLPSASESGDLVAAGFQGAIWLYGIPEDLDGLPNLRDASTCSTDSEASTPTRQLGRQNSTNSTRSNHKTHDSSGGRIPQWQLLLDRFRNTFVEGRKIAVLDQVSAMSWVDDCSTLCHGERLVAVAPGVSGQQFEGDDDGMAPVDGGRICILDFNYSPYDGERRFVTVEVGDREPEILEEEHRDLDTEVAIVRRRTVAQRRGNRSHVSRSATNVARLPRLEAPPVPALPGNDSTFVPIPLPVRRASQQTVTSENSESASVDEDLDAWDAPYSHTNPRSGGVLRRAATAAAVNRRLNPRVVAQDHIEYRRADGREEHPHESDADNWEPPPPPYEFRQPLPPLPEHIQRSIQAEAVAALQHSRTQRSPTFDFTNLDSNTLHRSHTIASTSTADSRRERLRFQRAFSDSTIMTADRISLEEESLRPVTSPISGDFNDLYDVSPPGTPPLEPQADLPPARTVAPNSIPRRPVGAIPGSSPSSRRTASQPNILPRDVPSMEVQTEVSQAAAVITISESETMDRPGGNEELSSISGPLGVPTYPDDIYLSELTPPLSTMQTVPMQQHFQNEQIPEPQPTILLTRAETAPVAASHSMDDVPQPIWRHSTQPAAPKDVTISPPAPSTEPRSMMPSADQLARLNSRRGRPAGLTDPRRASGGSSTPHRVPSGGHSRNSSTGSFQAVPPPPRLTPDQAFANRSSAPRAAAGAHGSQSRQGLYPQSHNQYSQSQSPSRGLQSRQGLSPQPHNQYSQSQSPSRRGIGNSRHRAPSGSPGLRPPMQRLETIHSQISIPSEPSPFLMSKSMVMSRQPSRAGRSAAQNIKDAKKKGWRSSMKSSGKEKKDKYGGDGVSSAGWTDATRDGSVSGDRNGKKDKKCVVM